MDSITDEKQRTKMQENAVIKRQNYKKSGLNQHELSKYLQLFINDPLVLKKLQELHRQEEEHHLLEFMNSQHLIFNRDLCERHIPQMEESLANTKHLIQKRTKELDQVNNEQQQNEKQIAKLQEKIKNIYANQRSHLLKMKSLNKKQQSQLFLQNDQNTASKKKVGKTIVNVKATQIPKYNSKQLIVDMLLKSKKNPGAYIVKNQERRNKENVSSNSAVQRVSSEKVRSARLEAKNMVIDGQINRLTKLISQKMSKLEERKGLKKKLIQQVKSQLQGDQSQINNANLVGQSNKKRYSTSMEHSYQKQQQVSYQIAGTIKKNTAKCSSSFSLREIR